MKTNVTEPRKQKEGVVTPRLVTKGGWTYSQGLEDKGKKVVPSPMRGGSQKGGVSWRDSAWVTVLN